jgi:hypothetical protein
MPDHRSLEQYQMQEEQLEGVAFPWAVESNGGAACSRHGPKEYSMLSQVPHMYEQPKPHPLCQCLTFMNAQQA